MELNGNTRYTVIWPTEQIHVISEINSKFYWINSKKYEFRATFMQIENQKKVAYDKVKTTVFILIEQIC